MARLEMPQLTATIERAWLEKIVQGKLAEHWCRRRNPQRGDPIDVPFPLRLDDGYGPGARTKVANKTKSKRSAGSSPSGAG